MARRDLSTFRTVTQQVAESPDRLPIVAAEIGQKIIEQSQEAKINENFSKAQLDLSALQNQYQLENEADPMANIQQYRKARQKILDDYGNQISPLFRGSWNQNALKLARQNDAEQQAWGIRRARSNTVLSINESMKNSYLLANQNGQAFGKSANTEIESYLDFANQKQQLAEFGVKNLGEMTTKEMLLNFDKDYLKSFVSGVASSNPDKAQALLQDPRLQEQLTSDEMDGFERVISREQKQRKVAELAAQTTREAELPDIISSPEGDYYTKRLEIDQMEFRGEIGTKAATKARRVLESKKAVDAVTSSDDMAELVTQMYDLNAIADTSAEDYLTGVQNIRQEIMVRQSDGRLSAPDAQKLQSQLRTLTAAKTANASTRVGYNFYDANKRFESLPPQYRAKATRELFYRTQGQEGVTKQQYDTYASEIIDGIKGERRSNTVQRVNKITMDDDAFLKTTVNVKTGLPYDMNDVRETAKKYGITEKEVIEKMKAKR